MIFSSMGLHGQDFSALSYPVFQQENTLDFPFSGSWGTPQFNQIDVDLDGVEDLVIFDRTTGQISVLLLKNNTYKYTNQYDEVFPDVFEWLILKDFDNDGIKDIFTAPERTSNSSIILYKGQLENNRLEYEQVFFPYGEGDVISYYFFGNYFGVYVARTDIPAIYDIDQDGDLDILSFESGGGTINYYQNRCVEENLPPEQFKMDLVDRCWGKFRESVIDESIVLSDDPGECAEGAGFRHAGSTITLFDTDNDQDLDILLGDTDYPGLIFIENGDKEQAFGISKERDYPQYDVPVNLDWFLGSFILDVDLDGQMELLVSPNTSAGSKNFDNIWMYRDTDPSEKVHWEFETDQFLLDQTIDWGGEVFPVFEDIDQDGLTDLLLGTAGLIDNGNKAEAKLIFYKNTGTSTQPAFTLWDDDYLSFSQKNHRYLAPAFGDLNGDGVPELIVGLSNGKLAYFDNDASSNAAYQFSLASEVFMDIDVGYRALPCLFDINGDGLNDLVVGNELSYNQNGQIGSVALFINKGTLDESVFDPTDPDNRIPWAGIALHENNFNTRSMVRPYIVEGKTDLFMVLGSIRGTIGLYSIKSNGTAEMLDQNLNAWDFGSFSAPAMYDLDNDGFLEIIVGTATGGIRLFNTDLPSDVSSTFEIHAKTNVFNIYPNPVSKTFTVELTGNHSQSNCCSASIYNSLGYCVLENIDLNKTSNIDVESLPGGIYWIKVFTGFGYQTKPFFVQ